MSRDAAIESALEEFGRVLRREPHSRIEPFLSRVTDQDRGELYGELLTQALVTRSRGGESPWIADYLAVEMGIHRDAVCGTLTEHLFAGDADAARQLEVLEFGEYVATGVVGFGGFGTVFRARSPSHPKRFVAVKLAHAGPGPADVLLEHEAHSLAQADGIEGVPEVHGRVRQTRSGGKYLVMEFVDGVSLDAWLASEPVADRNVQFDVCKQLVQIVNRIHQVALVHGDLTPANIMVGGKPRTPRVTLVDFGNCNRGLRPNPLRIFTSQYAAPERLLGDEADTSTFTDGWSVGVLLHRILGKYPFGEIPPSATDKELGSHFSNNRNAHLPDDVPPALVQAIENCLLPDPAERRRHMSLNDLLASIPGPREYAEWLRTRTGLSRATVAVDSASQDPRGNRRHYVKWLSAAVVVALLCGVAAIAFNNRGVSGSRMTGTGTSDPSSGDVLGRADALVRQIDAAPTEESAIPISLQLIDLIRNSKAPSDATGAAEWFERHRNAVNRLGIFYRMTGKMDDADRTFNELLRLSPESDHWRGIALLELGNDAAERMPALAGGAREATKAKAVQYYNDAIKVFRHPQVNEEQYAKETEGRLAKL